MIRGKLLVLLVLFGIALSFLVSASHLDDEPLARFEEKIDKKSGNFDNWIFREDLKGKNRGFVLTHSWGSPEHTYQVKQEDSDLFSGQRYQLEVDWPNPTSLTALRTAMDTYRLNKIRRIVRPRYSSYYPYYRSYPYSSYSYYGYGSYGARSYW